MNAIPAANFGQRAQLAHCPAIAAMSASVSLGIGYVCVAAIKASRRFTLRRHGFGLSGVNGALKAESARHMPYSPVCMRTMASLTSCSAIQVSRDSATAASYSAPRFRMPCALARCASARRRLNLQRASKAFLSLMANSSRFENLSHPSTDGSGRETGRNSTGSDNAHTLRAPKRSEFINQRNNVGFKTYLVHEGELFVRHALVAAPLPDARETFRSRHARRS